MLPKCVPAATSGDEKVCTTVFPLVKVDCQKFPLLIIDKGAVAPNRPNFRATVYFFDTLVNANNLPDDLIIQCEKLTTCASPPYTLNKRVVRLPVQPQVGDDCGMCEPHCPEFGSS